MVLDSEPHVLVPAGKERAEERDRVLGLMRLVYSRLMANKWRGCRAEYESLMREVEIGTQLLELD